MAGHVSDVLSFFSGKLVPEKPGGCVSLNELFSLPTEKAPFYKRFHDVQLFVGLIIEHHEYCFPNCSTDEL